MGIKPSPKQIKSRQQWRHYEQLFQGRQKRLTQGLLDLKRLYWNTHVFTAGRRKKQSPYGRLGLVLPPGSWWQLLQMPPEQLRQQLSALNPAA